MKFGKLSQRGGGTPSKRSGSRTSARYDTHDEEADSPYIKDFAFYKARFTAKHKEIQARLRDFALIVERF